MRWWWYYYGTYYTFTSDKCKRHFFWETSDHWFYTARGDPQKSQWWLGCESWESLVETYWLKSDKWQCSKLDSMCCMLTLPTVTSEYHTHTNWCTTLSAMSSQHDVLGWVFKRRPISMPLTCIYIHRINKILCCLNVARKILTINVKWHMNCVLVSLSIWK